MKNFKFILAFILLFGTAFSTLNVSIGDQGDNVRYASNGSLVDNANLTVLFYDASSGGNLFYNQTFVSAITNGSWNVMLGESQPLSLDYGVVYWKDYEINGENLDFINGSGSSVDRQFWYSPLGEVQPDMINSSGLTISQYWNRTGWTLRPSNFTDYVEVNEFMTVGVDTDGYIQSDGNRILTIKSGDGECFAANTMIQTPSGYVRIDNMNIGDDVVSFDPDTGIYYTTEVTNITTRIVSKYYTLNNVVNTTEEHPFYTDSGWKQVKDLVLGDKLYNGSMWVTLFSKTETTGSMPVYNLHVTKPYTFFANTFLVHNKDLTPRPGKDLFLYGGYPYLASTFGDTYIAYDGSINIGKAIIGGFLELYSGIQLYDDTPIYFDTAWTKSLTWDSVLLGFLFNDSLYVEGNTSSDYFIGDGSLLTNITADNLNINDNEWLYLDTNDSIGIRYNATSDYVEINRRVSVPNMLVANAIQADLGYFDYLSLGYPISPSMPFTVSNTSGTQKFAIDFLGNLFFLGNNQYINWNESSIGEWDYGTYKALEIMAGFDPEDIILMYNNVNVTGNVSADYFIGDGSLLTGISSYWNRTGTTLITSNVGDDVNLTGNLDVSKNTNSANYSVNGTELIFSNRDIADVETADHNIGTFNRSIVSAKNLTAGNDGDFLSVNSSGFLTLNGSARVYKEVQQYAYNIYGLAGTRNGVTCVASGLSSFNSTWLALTYDDGSGVGSCESSVSSMRMPSDYVDGSDFNISVSWSAVSTTGNVVFGVGVGNVSNSDNYPAVVMQWVTGTTSAPATTYTRKTENVQFNGSGVLSNDDLAIIFYRDADNAADTMTGDALVFSYKLIYLSDRIGS